MYVWNVHQVAQENRRQAMQLNLLGKHREALQKISIAIETDPAVAEFHVLRLVSSFKNILSPYFEQCRAVILSTMSSVSESILG